MIQAANIDVSKYELDFEDFYEKYQKVNEKSDEYLILDFRPDDEVCNGFIPLSIICDMKFFPKLISKKSKLLLITSPYYEEDVISYLLSNGYKNIEGFLSGGINTWISNKKPLTLCPETQNPNIVDTVIDCREPREWNYGVLDCESIAFMQLSKLPDNYHKLKKSVTYGVICKRGGRSLLAASYMMSKGYNVVNLGGGLRSMVCNGMKLVKKIK